MPRAPVSEAFQRSKREVLVVSGGGFGSQKGGFGSRKREVLVVTLFGEKGGFDSKKELYIDNHLFL